MRGLSISGSLRGFWVLRENEKDEWEEPLLCEGYFGYCEKKWHQLVVLSYVSFILLFNILSRIKCDISLFFIPFILVLFSLYATTIMVWD